MHVKSIAECSKGSILHIKLPVVIKIFVLSDFEWPFYTGFTVHLFQNALWCALLVITQTNFRMFTVQFTCAFFLCA